MKDPNPERGVSSSCTAVRHPTSCIRMASGNVLCRNGPSHARRWPLACLATVLAELFHQRARALLFEPIGFSLRNASEGDPSQPEIRDTPVWAITWRVNAGWLQKAGRIRHPPRI